MIRFCWALSSSTNDNSYSGFVSAVSSIKNSKFDILKLCIHPPASQSVIKTLNATLRLTSLPELKHQKFNKVILIFFCKKKKKIDKLLDEISSLIKAERAFLLFEIEEDSPLKKNESVKYAIEFIPFCPYFTDILYLFVVSKDVDVCFISNCISKSSLALDGYILLGNPSSLNTLNVPPFIPNEYIDLDITTPLQKLSVPILLAHGDIFFFDPFSLLQAISTARTPYLIQTSLHLSNYDFRLAKGIKTIDSLSQTINIVLEFLVFEEIKTKTKATNYFDLIKTLPMLLEVIKFRLEVISLKKEKQMIGKKNRENKLHFKNNHIKKK